MDESAENLGWDAKTKAPQTRDLASITVPHRSKSLYPRARQMKQVVKIFLLCPLMDEELRNTRCLLLLHLYVSDKVLLCRPSWSQPRHPSASASWMPSSEVCATMPNSMVFLLFIYFKILFASRNFLLHICIWQGKLGQVSGRHKHTQHSAHVDVSGQLAMVVSFLSPWGLGLNSDYQAWQQTHLLVEPSFQPLLFHCNGANLIHKGSPPHGLTTSSKSPLYIDSITMGVGRILRYGLGGDTDI